MRPSFLTLAEARSLESAVSCNAARTRAAQVLVALRRVHVRASIVGSVAKRRAGPGSDIDVLVLKSGSVSAIDIVGLIESAAGEYQVDVIFAESIRPEAVEDMLLEARHAPAVCSR